MRMKAVKVLNLELLVCGISIIWFIYVIETFYKNKNLPNKLVGIQNLTYPT